LIFSKVDSEFVICSMPWGRHGVVFDAFSGCGKMYSAVWEAWNQRMLGYRGPAQPSPTLGDRSMLDTFISKSDASAATRTRL
jgi:hypothetical protein